MSRLDDIRDFLKPTKWADADISFLAGDASPRKYYRLVTPDLGTAVVMDAPPSLGNDNEPFIQISRHLIKQGLRAPRIFELDQNNGFLLLEDFGDHVFFDHVQEHPASELKLYSAALDALAHLQTTPLPQTVGHYGPTEMADVSTLAIEWYSRSSDKRAFRAEMQNALERLDWSRPSLVLRDFHAQNLIWLEDETGLSRVGLLDFQDALIGHPFYDAVSLIYDARRDVSDTVRQTLLDRLATNFDSKALFNQTISTLSAQRNLRILGVFARLCCRDGKAAYVDLIPRVWKNLMRDLECPSLIAVKTLVAEFPLPTEDFLESLRAQCGQRTE